MENLTLNPDRKPKVDSVYISEIEVQGLNQTTKGFFEHMTGIRNRQILHLCKTGRMVRRVFGTRYYNRIVYSLVPVGNNSAKIIFDVVENATTFAKLGNSL